MPENSFANRSENAPTDWEAAFKASERRFRLLVDGASNFAMFLIDKNGCIASWNAGAKRILGYEEAEILGQHAAIIFTPEDQTQGAPEQELSTALRDGKAADIRWHQRKDGTRFWADGILERLTGDTGEFEGFAKILRDATHENLAEERERARISQIFEQTPAFMAALRGPKHIFDMANPPYYQLVEHRDIIGKSVAEALPEVVEQGFVGLLDQVYQSGIPFVGKAIPIMLQVKPNGPLEERFVDFTYQRLLDTEGAVSGILAHGIDLTDRKRLEQERERLLEEQRARAEREALLNKIGEVTRATAEPEAILQAAVVALGEGLGADRCYFVRTDLARDTTSVHPEWLRESAGLKPFIGQKFRPSSYAVNRNASYQTGQTQVVNDVLVSAAEDAPSLLTLGVRSLVRVPINVGTHGTGLTVMMAHQPRVWTNEEVQLIENVAALVRSALAVAQNQQRERNIAQQLQDALIPSPPTNLPSLALASFYRPALAESSVGGDFFDVFPVKCGGHALVVADLSGKGLAAASQVATVRNMLRFALYNTGTLAEAITMLHSTLEENSLLTGFATLFVGVHDGTANTLTYVNCGQEPGLIWRASTRSVDMMTPTGPVLGGFGEGNFEQNVVALASGDVLALFTDGLTEVGPSRKTQLEIEGVVDVLRECCSSEPAGKIVPSSVVDCLIAGVDDFARGGARDDIALLVGVVT